jgi:hypothetical protein
MKKLLIVVVLVLFVFSSLAMAKPFLVCDPQPGVDYILLVNGVEVTSLAVEDRLYYDLQDVPIGANDISVRAYNMWGESSPVPFSFARPANVTDPANIRIQK